MLQSVILIWPGSSTGNVRQRYLNDMDSFSNPTAFSACPTASKSGAYLRHLVVWFVIMPEATGVSAHITEPKPEFQVTGIQLALQTLLKFWTQESLQSEQNSAELLLDSTPFLSSGG